VIDGHDVVAFIPYGRQNTVSVLFPYLRREHERGQLDELWLCLNTDPEQVDDLRYAYQLAREHRWVRCLDRPRGLPRLTPKQRNTGYFYRYMTDPGTVFVRFDDDIVYVHPDALANLVSARVAMHESCLTAFAMIWNNAIVSWYLQQHGKIPSKPSGPYLGFRPVGEPFCMDPVGWADGAFGADLHRYLLDGLETTGDAFADRVYLYQDIPLAPRQQFSVSCFAVLGADYAALPSPGILDFPEEEHWHTVHRPPLVGKGNVIVGNSLVSHYTFYPQGQVIRGTDILDRYRTLSEKIG